MSRLQVAISQDFLTAFASIPRVQQRKVNIFVSKFRSNPRGAGINYEKIHDAANQRFRSVRIDRDYRGIVLQPERGNVYVLLWVDKHDDAYDWARRHRCEINPITGALQLYESTHEEIESAHEGAVETEAPRTPEPDSKTAEPLVQASEEELLQLGVPVSRLTRVRALSTLAELEAMARVLPQDAWEALYFLADGLPLDEVMDEYGRRDTDAVDTTDVALALQHEQTQRRFHVVEDELELQQMLNAPLEQWRVFLHPTQRRLVERHWNGPVRVLGGAGTGKTVVAMHRARWLASHVLQRGERLLVTTFTRNLATDIEANLRKICSTQEMNRIDVVNFDAWVVRFLKRERHALRVAYPGDSDTYDACWERAIQLVDSSLGKPESFYKEEWEQVVLPQRVLSRTDYLRASRSGRGTPLSRRQRAALWPVFEEMRLQMQHAGAMTQPDACFAALDLLQAGGAGAPYRAAVVDEAQDFGPEAMQLLRVLVLPAADDLFITGDAHQRIYRRRMSLGACDINIRGRGRRLKINYRTTEQIRQFAVAVLEGVTVDDLDEGATSRAGYVSLTSGRVPELRGFQNAAEEANWIAGRIGKLVSEGARPQDICVVARIGGELGAIAAALDGAGIQHRKITRNLRDDRASEGVRLANMHRVKGLEFRTVFMAAVRDGVVPLPAAINSASDETERKTRNLNERALLHVASSRAVQSLYVTWSGKPSALITELLHAPSTTEFC